MPYIFLGITTDLAKLYFRATYPSRTVSVIRLGLQKIRTTENPF